MPAEVEVRRVVPEDWPALRALRAGEPVATAVGFVEDGRAWLAAVYVSPAERGRALLARLLEPLAAWARGQGCAELALEVHEDNARARSAYARLGFVDTGRRRPYPLDPNGDELEMTLVLG